MTGRTSLGPCSLVGKHVRLEPLTIGHVPALLEAATEDRASYEWTFVPGTAAEMTAYVETALELAATNLAVPFAMVSAGSVVGTTRFAAPEYLAWPGSHRSDGGPLWPDGIEIGWTWLAGSAQRTAINTEAKLLMLGHAFETWHVAVVRLKTDRRNARSRAAIERIGGRLDGILRAHAIATDGQPRDSAYYSIIASEWPGVRTALVSRLATTRA